MTRSRPPSARQGGFGFCPKQVRTAAMPSPDTIIVYTDYKSPYAYLAKDEAYALA